MGAGAAHGPAIPPAQIRLACYNVEWFNALFDDAGQLLQDDAAGARFQISRGQQARALGQVFSALDADGVMIIEAPDTNARRSTITALENFAARYHLRARRAIHGFSSDTEQEIAFLYDPDRLQARHDPKGKSGTRAAPHHFDPHHLDPHALGQHLAGRAATPRFDGSFRYDLNTDRVADRIRFSKPPLELAVTLPDGRALRLIGVHAKSKNPHGAVDAASEMRISIENRRKQLAQCIWLRARVDEHLDAGDDLLVMGDFNDGPGLDEFEKLFGLSGVEVVLGSEGDPALRLSDPHADLALCSRVGLCPTTARFWLAPQKRYFEALLDFIMASRGLVAERPVWQIWHPFNEPKVSRIPGLPEALLQASDHFPVTIDLPLRPVADGG